MHIGKSLYKTGIKSASNTLISESVGKKLVMAVVQYARVNNLKIIPLCPFAKSVFDKTKEIQDLIF